MRCIAQFIYPQITYAFACPPHPASLTLRRLPIKGKAMIVGFPPGEAVTQLTDAGREIKTLTD